MDRNIVGRNGKLILIVALRKESVDRNKIRITPVDGVSRSLSARRAWIEMSDCQLERLNKMRRSPQGERG